MTVSETDIPLKGEIAGRRLFRLPKKVKWRSKKKMSYGNPFSHIQNVKGIALDLPFCRFRYVTIERDPEKGSISQSNSSVLQRLDGRAPRREAPVRRITYARPAEVTTLGIDPLVSSASVIHELFFGRASQDSGGVAKKHGYPIPGEEIPHVLDLFV